MATRRSVDTLETVLAGRLSVRVLIHSYRAFGTRRLSIRALILSRRACRASCVRTCVAVITWRARHAFCLPTVCILPGATRSAGCTVLVVGRYLPCSALPAVRVGIIRFAIISAWPVMTAVGIRSSREDFSASTAEGARADCFCVACRVPGGGVGSPSILPARVAV
jgi:hypothetical protein